MAVVVNERLDAARRILKELREFHGNNHEMLPRLDLLEDVLVELGGADEELLRKNVLLFDFREDFASANLRYRDLLDSIPYPCLLTDPRGVILESNPAAGALLDADSRAFKSIDLLIEAGFLEKHLDALQKGQPVRQVCQVMSPGGGSRSMRVEAVPAIGRKPGDRCVRWIFMEEDCAQADGALYSGAALLEGLMQSAKAVIYIRDTEGRYLMISSMAERLIGRRMKGLTPRDIFPAGIAEAILANDRKVISSGKVMEFEEVMEIRGARKVNVAIKFPIHDTQGRVIAVGGISTDITPMKIAQNRTEENGRLLREVIDNLDDVITIKDTTGRYIAVNRRYEALFRLERSSVIGKTPHEIFPMEKAEMLLLNDTEAVNTRMPVEFEEEFSFDGAVRRFSTSKFPIMDSRGVVRAVCGISKKTAAPDSPGYGLKNELELLKVVMENSSSAIYIKDREGRYLFVNGWYERNLHVSRESLIGKSAYDLYPEEIAGGLLENDRKVMESNAPMKAEEKVLLDDGLHYFMTNKFPVYDTNGGITAVCGISTDITELKKTEEALRQSEARLAAAQSMARLGNWELDVATGREWLSTEAYRIFRLHPDQNECAFSILDLLDREEAQKVKKAIDEAIYGKKPFVVDYRITTPGAETRVIHSEAGVSFDKNGVLVKISGTIQDITEIKRSEERINRLNRILRTFYEINHMIVRETDRLSLLERTCGILVEHGGFACAWVGIKDRKTGVISKAAHAYKDSAAADSLLKWNKALEACREERPVKTGDVCVCNAEPVCCNNIVPEWREAVMESGYRSCASFPISVRGEAAGIMYLFSSEPGTFVPELVELLNELADNTGYALQAFDEIDERRSAEAKLQISERKFREVLESVPVGIILTTVDGGVIDSNNWVLKMFGYSSKEEFLAAGSETFYWDKEERKNVLALLMGGNENDHELRLRRKDGTPFWASITFTRKIEENGSHLIVTIQDISSRKVSEEALKESEERFRQIFEQSTDPQLILGMNTCRVLDSSPGTTALFEFTREEIMEKGPALFISGEDIPRFQEAVLGAEYESSFSLDRLECVRKDGAKVIVSLRGRKIRLRRSEVIYCIMRDITGMIRMEDEARFIQAKLIHANKMTSIGTLASGVAHEINNPNNFILFNSSLLGEAWDDAAKILGGYYRENGEFSIGGLPYSEMREVVPELLAGITEGARRIKGIIDNLKDFSRMDRGGLDGEFDINQAVASALSMIGTQVNKFTEKFSMELGKDLPVVKGSMQKIEQVIINLIMNSLHALPARAHGVRVETGYDDEAGMVEITVQDEGCGMPPEIIERITEPFFTTKTDTGGMGLGLSISYSIIKEHKGALEFTSEPGKGTVARIALPASIRRMDTQILKPADPSQH